MSVAAQPFTGVFEADRNHSTFQFAVRHMKVSTFRGSFRDLEARLTADESRAARNTRSAGRQLGRAIVKSQDVV